MSFIEVEGGAYRENIIKTYPIPSLMLDNEL